ncbi:secretin N-terminal domain-containing protein [Burkholderia sp. Ac-20365]|uniref:secretin N-terminal domain-containing protein n=1 Tax=Burkholderia sp. Ac-20365 TaxID=2703897 RepID=UPI00197B14A2|nr:secretin N-terminal domain-containing protein [Burkholderia sp. Ac-20365]MBN3759283.1 secretion protein [Burkholderia sp. Ac-20365]
MSAIAIHHLRRGMLLVALTVPLAACVDPQSYRDGRKLLAAGQVDQGVAKLKDASMQEPQDAKYREVWLAEREKQINDLMGQGDQLAASVARDAARAAYQHVLAISPGNERAIAGLAALDTDARLNIMLSRAEALFVRHQPDDARHLLDAVLTEAPTNRRALELQRKLAADSGSARVEAALAAAYRKPIRIDFRDAPLKQVFDVISRSSGMNFLFDRDVKTDQRTTIFLKNSTIDATVRYVLATNQLAQQVLDENTVLIYPNTAPKVKDYQELAVRTFFLSNTDAKTIANTLKTILKIQNVIADEKLNVVIVRDSPDAIRMAERLVSLEDVPEPEVMLEVEVLEVQRNHELNLGIAWPASVNVTPLPIGSVIAPVTGQPATNTGASSSYPYGYGGTGMSSSNGSTPALTLHDLLHQTARTIGLSSLQATANANVQDSDVKLLTNPRIRVRNHEKAKILIGERVPNITSTATSTGFLSQSVNYLDIGLTLNVEPTVYLDDTVGIKLALEVSSLGNSVTTTTGTAAYQIGTRSASTVLQLKNGETDVLAGLIDNEERVSGNKLPGIGQLPILDHLFGATDSQAKNTEIVLAITPHLVRNVRRPDADLAYFTSGTETNMRSMIQSNGLALPAASSSAGAASSGSGNGTRFGAGVQPNNTNGASGAGVGAGAYNGSGAGAYNGGDGLFAPGAPPVAGTAQMTIEGPPQAKTGDSVTVSLSMSADQPVASASSIVSFDATKLQFVGVTEGDFLKQGGAPTSFSSRVGPGQVQLSDSVQGGMGAGSKGAYAVLSFRAVAAVSQTSVKITPGSVVGLTGTPITLAPPSAYTFTIIATP